MLSSLTQAILVEQSWTPYALDSIYKYQVSGETIEWHYMDASNYAPHNHYIDAANIIASIDSVIDLDFVYTPNYQQNDYLVYVYDTRHNGILGSHTAGIDWGLTEIFYDPYESYQSNLNTFVHELGHYLGLGEPGYDWRFDQCDTAMSYNPDFANVPGGWQNFFTGNDLAVLIELHGAENDFFENTVVNGRQFLSNGVDSLTGQSNFNIGLLGGNDFLEVVGGSDNFANGNMGDDTLNIKGGRGRYLGGSEADKIIVNGADTGTHVNGNRGKDIITGSVAGVIYRGGSEDDLLKVSAGTVYGDKGADKFQAVAGPGVAVIKDYTAELDSIVGVYGGSFVNIAQGLMYGTTSDQMLILAGITDASQVTVV